jgi:hypothetical protein
MKCNGCSKTYNTYYFTAGKSVTLEATTGCNKKSSSNYYTIYYPVGQWEIQNAKGETVSSGNGETIYHTWDGIDSRTNQQAAYGWYTAHAYCIDIYGGTGVGPTKSMKFYFGRVYDGKTYSTGNSLASQNSGWDASCKGPNGPFYDRKCDVSSTHNYLKCEDSNDEILGYTNKKCGINFLKTGCVTDTSAKISCADMPTVTGGFKSGEQTEEQLANERAESWNHTIGSVLDNIEYAAWALIVVAILLCAKGAFKDAEGTKRLFKWN